MAQQNNRARQQRQLIIIILIAVLLLAGGAYAVFNNAKDKEKQAVNTPPAGKIAVPVAIRNINIGERIGSNMIRMSYRNPERVPEDALLRPDQFIGHYATKPILAADHFRSPNISDNNVEGGYSALASPGKRVVILNASTIPGAIGTLRVGDHIDLLAISSNPEGGGGSPQPAFDPAKAARGGTQPGGYNPAAKKPTGSAGSGTYNAMTASLVAEGAEVLRTPTRGRDKEFVVLQMSPQDAHVTTLMVSAGATMRVVFRPSNDVEKITADRQLSATTRMPKPEPDPDRVEILLGSRRNATVPYSERYAPAELNPNYNKNPNTLQSQNFSDSNTPIPIQMITNQSPQIYE